jgi:FlaG/FlaF family flagellin (archaellin)
MKRKMKKEEDAVSPVVGVMLMLVVTIILAAVVSGFAGGLISGTEKAPSITMDVAIKNTGYYASSLFEAKVISVSEGIKTDDLKLITSWTNSTGGKGGATVTATTNTWMGDGDQGWQRANGTWVAPWGYGPGIAATATNTGIPKKDEQQFGNYTLLGGTTMFAVPVGGTGYPTQTWGEAAYGNSTRYVYTNWEYDPEAKVDGMQAVLGENWESLRTGDIVNVRMIYLPNGMTLFKKDVVVS